MNRLMCSILSIIFVCASQLIGANVVTTIGNVSGYRNDKGVEVDISLSNVSGLGIVSSDMVLNYDSARLTFSTATFKGTIANHFPEPIFNKNNSGTVSFSLYGSTAITGQGNFIKLFFDVNSSAQNGVSSLTIPKIIFNDGVNLTTSTVSGSFTILSIVDTSSPTAVVGLAASNISQTGWTLSWNAATDNVGIAGYYVYRDNVKVGTVTSGLSWTASGLTSATTYYCQVTAYDSTGNESAKQSPSFKVVTLLSSAGDTTSPTAVVGLTASNISKTGWTLGWNAATDNVGVKGYYVYRDNVKVATLSSSAISEKTIWSGDTVPGTIDGGPDSSVELGVKFRSDISGTISGIRFYKCSTNTGTHTGSLWTSGGTLLASGVFTDETASGWQQVNFASPVAISSNTVYVASYHANNGHYSENTNYFTSTGFDNTPMHALASGVSGSNGVYAYGSSSIFPNQSWNNSNYWVDVVFCSQASGLSWTAAGLTAATTYYCQVTAYDAAGNESAKQSPSFKIVTLSSNGDTTPPSVVTGLSSSNITTTSFVLRWAAATDNVKVAGYYIYKDGSKVATITSGLVYNATGLRRGRTYTYKVSAYDDAGNESAQSQGLVVKTRTYLGISQNISYNQSGSLSLAIEEDFGINVDIPSNSFMEDIEMSISKIEPIEAGANASKIAFEITNNKDYQPTKEITITINYLNESISGLDKSKLVICYYNENGSWVEIPTTAYPSENRLIGKIKHLTKFQVFQKASKSDLNSLVVYPNPYRGSLNSNGVVFSGLTSRANIKIYAITGELIRELSDEDGDGQCVWDTKNQAGSNIASGVYVYNIVNSDNKSQKVKGKVAIIR